MVSAGQQFVLSGFGRHAGSCHSADMPAAARGRPRIARTLRDLVLIVMGWAILIGAILYPAAQLVGLLTCAVALAIGSRRRSSGETGGDRLADVQ